MLRLCAGDPGGGCGASAGVCDGDAAQGNNSDSTTTTKKTTSTQGGDSNASAALAIARMNEDYLNLDYNLLHLLMVTCANENDPTRVHPTYSDGQTISNQWLLAVCNRITPDWVLQNNVATMQHLLSAAPPLLSNTARAHR